MCQGRPIPARNRAPSRAEGRRAFDLPARARVLLVFGGSQGAASLNELVVETFGETGPAVLHLSGERDYERLRGRVRRDDYKLVPFTDDFGAAVAAADLVVARAGGLVWEIAAAGKPAILVPYPFATADHQAKNARFFERAGGAITVPETELGRVPDLARSLLGDADRLKEMGAAMKRLARPDAADEIAEELIAPLADRKLWFVGIGGAGLSGYAVSPKPGEPRSRAGTDSRRRISSTCAQPASRHSLRRGGTCARRLRGRRLDRLRGASAGGSVRSSSPSSSRCRIRSSSRRTARRRRPR